jgi:hypothetical protein
LVLSPSSAQARSTHGWTFDRTQTADPGALRALMIGLRKNDKPAR